MVSGFGGLHPIERTPDEESVTMSRKQDWIRVLVDECWEAETNRDVPLISFHGPHGNMNRASGT